MPARNSILADTCIWVEYFRTTSSLSEELRKLITEERIVTTGVVILELLQGAKTSKTKELIKETLLALPVLETTLDDWVLAGDLGQVLRLKGLTIPATDLLLAAVAQSNACAIFTTDSHFSFVADFHRYLEVGAPNSAAFYLNLGSNIFQRFFPDIQRSNLVIFHAFCDKLEGIIENGISY